MKRDGGEMMPSNQSCGLQNAIAIKHSYKSTLASAKNSSLTCSNISKFCETGLHSQDGQT